jgi:hypothetical protein
MRQPSDEARMLSLHPNLVDAVRRQSAILFLGAGASYEAMHPAGAKIPSGEKLRDLICDKFLNGSLKNKTLSAVADVAVNEASSIAFNKFIRDTFIDFGPADFHRLLPTFRWHAIVSTNFDLVVERAYDAVGKRLQSLVTFTKNGQGIETALKAKTDGVPFLKIHGCIDSYNDQDIPFILATEQYVRYSRNRDRLFERFKSWGCELPIIFCGYSISDPHLQEILFDLFDLNLARPTFYTIDPNISEYEERYWTRHRVFPIRGTFADFLKALDAEIPAYQRAPFHPLGGGSTTVRSFYRVAGAHETASLQTFLADDVTHIRRDLPVPYQEPKEFYRGYDPGWSAIVQKLDVTRQVTDTVLVDAILLSEEERPRLVDLYVLKGPAGNGKTVCLKRVAWETAIEYEQIALFLNLDGAIRRDAIEELANLTGKRIFLFVDKIAYFHDEVRGLIRYFISKKLPLTIIGAERDSDWNIRCDDLEEYVIEHFPVRFLSEREIRSLLDLLEKHKSLGVLEPVPFQQRLDAFLNRAERQLLVALHEATLGKPFEEIILEEYQQVTPPEARGLYLDVCTLNRLAVPVRAGLIARVSGIRFTDFRERFFKPLDTIVKAEIDKYSGDHVYIARHHHVAQMVFDQVLIHDDQKFDQMVRVMRGLNVDYSSDAAAFRQLIRGKAVAATLRSYDIGQKFYDVASQVSNDAHVAHQRAIFEMEHENGNLAEAEKYLTQAASLRPEDRNIQHSLAHLDREKAQQTRDPLLRERLRSRAKNRLATLSSASNAMPHVFHTKAEVAVDELRDLLSNIGRKYDNMEAQAVERQIIEATRAAELALAEGLQRFPENGVLLGLEASFRHLISQDDRAEAALRKAFQANKRQDWLAIRLARRLLDRAAPEEAKKVLQECLLDNSASKRVHFELAKFYMAHGTQKERSVVEDHLRSSFSQGDRNIDAEFWYARELFNNRKFDQAKAIFFRMSKYAIDSSLRTQIRGIIQHENGINILYRGVVSKKEDSYLFIECPDFPAHIFAHVSHVSVGDWEKIRVGEKLRFELGFTISGPAAVRVLSD